MASDQAWAGPAWAFALGTAEAASGIALVAFGIAEDIVLELAFAVALCPALASVLAMAALALVLDSLASDALAWAFVQA